MEQVRWGWRGQDIEATVTPHWGQGGSSAGDSKDSGQAGAD